MVEPYNRNASFRSSGHPRLSRQATGATDALQPVRIVHIGLGNFHRAHQAWYTARSEDSAGWGIAAFTGRSPESANTLAQQDGLYTLIERGAHRDHATVISSIVKPLDGADLGSFCGLLARREVAIVTLTVTESGYHLGADGNICLDDEDVASDITALRAIWQGDAPHAKVRTPIGRLVLGLDARRRVADWPIAVTPCDNILSNGELVQKAVRLMAACVSPRLAKWIDKQVSFVSTSVDRITPRTTARDRVTACQLTGWWDESPVITEPFSDWTLSGAFPAGRPRWESAGARIVTDIEPYERRKLWLLNGAHSALAYLGPLLACTTVAEAVGNPTCRALLRQLWAESARHLPPSLDAHGYCAALMRRFSNPRMEHRLDQIGMDGVAKLRVRIVPVALAELSAGRSGAACAKVLAAWIANARRNTLPRDAQGERVARATRSPGADSVGALLTLLDSRLAECAKFINEVIELAGNYDRGENVV